MTTINPNPPSPNKKSIFGKPISFVGITGPLILLTLVDFIARSAYMTGKTPVLPLFAASLGAGELLLGFISSISTFTGMVLKPLVGLLSDRQGRRWWLFVGTFFFILMPFVYQFIESPEQLIVLRLIHGFATAIYGPVTVAMVVEMSPENRAGRVGFFSLGRTGGYIVGPALGGFLLLKMDAVSVYTIIGLMSSLTLIPLFYLPETAVSSQTQKKRPSLSQQLKKSFSHSATTPAIWIASGFEAINYMVTYSAKAFLPIYALAVGRNTLEAGLFFTVQQAVTMAAKPLFGWIGDKWSHVYTILLAIFGMAGALFLLTFSANVIFFYVAAVILGLTEALIIPSTTALVAKQIDQAHIGTGLGIIGTLQNGSKIAGPILAGFLIALTSYEQTFQLMAIFILLAGMLIFARRSVLT
ncbi:MAG: MFS transporter [Chloroflexota bacterium]